MGPEPRQREFVECKTPEGRVLARVEIIAPAGADAQKGEDYPLVIYPLEEAQDYSEERLQLQERNRYEYRLVPAEGIPYKLTLLPQRGVQPSRVGGGIEDRGLIEPQDHCGMLPLTVIRNGDASQTPLAQGRVEVRSLKVGYREHYRGMLTFIGDKCASLLLDSRAPTKLRLGTEWAADSGRIEQQLEFLRHVLESRGFRSAVDQILRNPHRRIEEKSHSSNVAKPFKPGKAFAKQIGMATRRVAVPINHSLRTNVASLPAEVSVRSRVDFLDTAENRFAKMVLKEFRDFLVLLAGQLNQQIKSGKAETFRLIQEVRRLRGALESQLSRGFFPDVSPPVAIPVGSPVLQRKAGYRELLRLWLQFHAAAELVWDGADDVFLSGARNVATLYEYWMFFQLEALFRNKFSCDTALHELVVQKDSVPPQIVLKRGVQLKTPVSGVWAKSAGRNLKAEFQFNRKFNRNVDHERAGSWTRGVQPDYTISIWPAEYSREDAEANELMVHVHFDAKYRVERINDVLGDDSDELSSETQIAVGEARSNAKYEDLLKMHAYRDAIRRTGGAYVLYPGNPVNGNKRFGGFHEVLPGLGAFAVRPDVDGRAQGLEAVSLFLDQVIEHLANRTTARERVTYHVAESYDKLVVDAKPTETGDVVLPEIDAYSKTHRAIPPAEEMVLAAWYKNDAQKALAESDDGFVYVRLGSRVGTFHVHPNLARVRYVLLRTQNFGVAQGLLQLREPGFRIYTRNQLRDQLQRHAKGAGVASWEAFAGVDDDELIYALFRTRRDPAFSGQIWNGDKLMEMIEAFESDSRNALSGNLRRTSAYPRILPLESVLRARK